MPTLDPNRAEREDVGLLATHHDGKEPFSERFRRAKIRADMFGDVGESLTIGRYTVTGKLGEGAMGTVYRATDTALDRDVAVKVLHGRDATHRARMQIEAKALAKLSHPNVVTVHEVATEDDQLFVAMEYVAGQTLTRWLEGSPSGDVLVDVFIQAAQGLQAAHDAGVVHRDFKPDNVLVGDDGRVRVVDFGMARTPGATLVDEVDGAAEQLDARTPTLTRTGVLAGTPGYMSPEQFEGGRVDARADQFAFCIALHEAVWGVRPFEGETLGELAAAVVAGRVSAFGSPPRPELDPSTQATLRRVLDRGLARAPEDRFESMSALIEVLRSSPLPQKRGGLGVLPALRRAPGSLSSKILLSVGGLAAGGLIWMANVERRDARPAESAAAEVLVEKPLKCGPGTFIDGDHCTALEFTPTMVECADNICTVPRSVFFSGDDAPVRIDLQARFVRALEGDLPIGYKMFGIKDGTILDALGFEVGDVVTRLNDVNLADTRVEGVLGGLGKLQELDQVVVAFSRKGEPQTLTVRLLD